MSSSNKLPITSVLYAGGYYMCVEGSPRAEALQRANYAYERGSYILAEDLKQEALSKQGCAFEARENSGPTFAGKKLDVQQFQDDRMKAADAAWLRHLEAGDKKNN